jgi:adenosine deaminase
MEDCWLLENMLLAKRLCGFSDADLVVLAKNAINNSWAPISIKDNILQEIDSVYEAFHGS